MIVTDLDNAIADPKTYADEDGFHALFTHLRAEDPVHWAEPEGYRPFWIVTRHADVMEIEKQADRFINAPRTALRSIAQEEMISRFSGSSQPIRSLIQMDQPDHRLFRSLTQAWFLPKQLKELEAPIHALADEFVNRLNQYDHACDFVRDVAVWYPLRVIMLILGVPEQDAGLMLKATQQHFANTDPSVKAEEGDVEAGAAVRELFAYFDALAAERLKRPKNDAVSLLANAKINGSPISSFDRNSYFFLLAVAGHDTTSSSIAGTLHALIENPDQLALLQSDPAHLNGAIDEGIRWTSPVRHFFRTAQEDYKLRGRPIRAGDFLMLSYPSANRDEDVFEEPFSFNIARTKNPYLSFGYGPHLCLGQHMAKLEMRSLFNRMLPSIHDMELAGEPRWLESNFVGGLKSLPIQWKQHARIISSSKSSRE